MKYSIWGEDLLVQRKAYNIFREMQMVMELKQEPAILLSLEAVEKSLGLRYLCIFPDLNSVTPVRYIMEPEVRQSTRIEAGEYDAAGGGC